MGAWFEQDHRGEIRHVGRIEGQAKQRQDRDEKPEARARAGGDHPEPVVAMQPRAFVDGEPAESREQDAGPATTVFHPDGGMAEFVDQDGNEGRGHEQDHRDNRIRRARPERAAEQGGGHPEKGLDFNGDAEQREANHERFG